MNTKPYRFSWNHFPDVVLHADQTAVKKHFSYTAAKSGDLDAASELVNDTISEDAVVEIKKITGNRRPFLVSAHAYEQAGVNAIPEVLSDRLSEKTGFPVESSIVQINVVRHTGANGFARLARQALFEGSVVTGTDYFLVDDFVGQGGTLANLRGFIEFNGGTVIGATSLTGRADSAKITLEDQQLKELRSRHGQALEDWWRDRFGHGFDSLTQSEARCLARIEDADKIRDRIIAEEQTGDCRTV